MTAERSRQTAAWFAAHPRLKAGVVAANRWLPLIPFACYPALLIWLGLKLAAGQTQLLPAAIRAVLVPAAVFLGGTALRRALNFPRPYQQPGFVPLVQKERQGCSFPSPPCTERRCHCSGVAVFQPRRRGCADGRSPGHLRASGADRRTFCPGCSCRCYPWFCIGSGRYVAAVRPFAKKNKRILHFVLDRTGGVWYYTSRSVCFAPQPP